MLILQVIIKSLIYILLFNLYIKKLIDDESLKIQSVLDAIQIFHKSFVASHCNVGTKVEEKK